MVSIEILTSMRQLRVRYQARPRSSAQAEAAMAPSVGVKTPSVMPPTSSTGVIMARKASTKVLPSARQENFASAWYLRVWA